MAERVDAAALASASARSRSPRITAASPRSSGSTPSSGSSAASCKALVATASLELGIDIGDVDLVCQLGSPRSIASFLQRVGRSGHAVGGTPKGRLFPLSRDELVECAALLDSRRAAASSTACTIPEQPLDVLAQQIVAEVGGAGVGRGRAVRARPPRLAVPRAAARGFRRPCVACSRDGFTHAARPARRADPSRRRQRRAARPARRAPHRAHLGRRDPGQRRLPGAARAGEPRHRHASTRISRSRAWPATSSSSATRSYRILRVERGVVRVEDAHGQPPTHPVLARRGAGPQRRAVAVRLAPARRHRGAARRRSGRRRLRSAGSSRKLGLGEPAARRARRVSRRGARRARRAADAGHDRASSASSTKPAACSW